jgi:glutamate/tyrosine decarboxylase-like PLP-dependent enzyme
MSANIENPTPPYPERSGRTGHSHREVFERALVHAGTFRDRIGDRPPRPVIPAGELQALFDGPTPEIAADSIAVIDALNAAAEPGLTGSSGPRFFGWAIGGSHPVGVAADMLTSAWGQNAANYDCSPAAAMAEKVATRWLLDMIRLPRECSVGLVTGATMASFVCLAAARSAVLDRVGWDVETEGLSEAPRVRLFVGADAHVSIYAAMRYLGFGKRVVPVPTDTEGRMDSAALAQAMAEGGGPAIVIAQAGQMDTGAFDPMREIASICRQHGAWLHVDGAFGLWARAVPEMAELTAGIDEADSWSIDGHRWLQLPYENGFAIVRDAQAHRRAMEVTASYLLPASAAEYDPGQFVPELSRRARGFALWAQLRALGRQGLAQMLRRHCVLTRRLASRLASTPGVRVLNERHLNQIIVSFGTGTNEEREALTRAAIETLQTDNICLAGGTQWHGRWVLRLSVIYGALTDADVDRLAVAVLSAWRHVQQQAST